jgi:hypothetical protein
MPRLELYPFRYRHPLTGKWIRARYKAELHEIAERYAEYEITGPPEIREVDPKARHFNPFRREDAPVGDSIGNLGPMRAVVHPALPRRVIIAGVAV